jgi:hypothetical protein
LQRKHEQIVEGGMGKEVEVGESLGTQPNPWGDEGQLVEFFESFQLFYAGVLKRKKNET